MPKKNASKNAGRMVLSLAVLTNAAGSGGGEVCPAAAVMLLATVSTSVFTWLAC